MTKKAMNKNDANSVCKSAGKMWQHSGFGASAVTNRFERAILDHMIFIVKRFVQLGQTNAAD